MELVEAGSRAEGASHGPHCDHNRPDGPRVRPGMTRRHRFRISARLRYLLHQEGWLLLNMAATNGRTQRVVSEALSNSQGLAFHNHEGPPDSSRFHGLAAAAGPLEVVYQADVERDIAEHQEKEAAEGALIDLPPEVVRFLYPSRYCESDKLVRLAAKEFGELAPGHERVAGICNWIFQHIDYQPGATDAHTSAVEFLTLRAGVCRDFAHLGVAFCRAMGIPARYGSAYALGLPEPDYHAFFEVWLEGRWWYYDATRLAPQPGFVRVGIGHDAADTSVATMSSNVEFISMQIQMEQLAGDPIFYSNGPIGF